MKKTMRTVLICLLVLLIIGAAVGGYFIWRHHTLYIGRDAALGAAIDDAGVLMADTFDIDVDFEHEHGRSWYDVEFKTAGTDYEYVIDARTGEVLRGTAAPEHAG